MILGLLVLAAAAYRVAPLSVQAPASLAEAEARYAGFAAAGGWSPLPEGPPLEPGMTDARIAMLRRLMPRFDRRLNSLRCLNSTGIPGEAYRRSAGAIG